MGKGNSKRMIASRTARKAKRKHTFYSGFTRRKHEEMRAVLRECEIALTDWVRTYASDQCSPEQVTESYDRIRVGGGTLAYVARMIGRIREALKQ